MKTRITCNNCKLQFVFDNPPPCADVLGIIPDSLKKEIFGTHKQVIECPKCGKSLKYRMLGQRKEQ